MRLLRHRTARVDPSNAIHQAAPTNQDKYSGVLFGVSPDTAAQTKPAVLCPITSIRCTLPRDDVALHGTVPRDTILHIPTVRCPLNVRYPCTIVLAALPGIFLAEREWCIVFYTCTFAALGPVGARVIGYLLSIPTVLAR